MKNLCDLLKPNDLIDMIKSLRESPVYDLYEETKLLKKDKNKEWERKINKHEQ
jgi:hypothetical protein